MNPIAQPPLGRPEEPGPAPPVPRTDPIPPELPQPSGPVPEDMPTPTPHPDGPPAPVARAIP